MAIDVHADTPTDGPKPAFAPGETDSGEEFEVDDSDLEEDNAMLECLSDCFKGKCSNLDMKRGIFVFLYQNMQLALYSRIVIPSFPFMWGHVGTPDLVGRFIF